MMSPEELMRLAADTLTEKKARDVKILRVADVTTLADYFVIANGGSSRQLRTMADELEKVFEERGEPKLRREGKNGGNWTVIDFGAVIVHLFLEETRRFYDLERLWADAEVVASK